jgi:hypothetical protein
MEKSAALNARLVLILANHVGDEALMDEALRLARPVGPGRRAGRDECGGQDRTRRPGLGAERSQS